MATPGCTVLPFELLECIIELLASDPIHGMGSLKACSLACRSLLAITQPRVFSFISLCSPQQHSNFKLVLDANPSIANHVQSLHYEFIRGRYAHEPSTLERLRRVTSFALVFPRGIYWETASASKISSILSFIQSNNIVDLKVFFIQNLPISIFWYLPHLKVLDIARLSFANVPFSDNFSTPNEPPKLMSLKIDDCTQETWVNVIGEHLYSATPGIAPFLDLSGLEEFTLSLKREGSGHRQPIKPFLMPSQTLKSLSLTGYSNLDFKDLASNLNRSSLGTLKFVELGVYLKSREDDDPYSRITNGLEKIAGKNVLETLTIHVQAPTLLQCLGPSRNNWSQFDQLLSQSHSFPFLRRVDVKISLSNMYFNSPRAKSKLEDTGREHFKRLNNNPRLQFSFELSQL
ncbi:hypothetical protein GALMADRAFT_1191116 [Galerina marginata CBS 339.88]|uniref:F-box domain-containing protein n=1 Tax=Galerina marginata (strain CBS 339.88) TaxID=685588 RepID=A0A067TAZ6_GALM3|nr:hypothetical protein GALMADRAFT_1191116 [Galerina marginata CBS 339.88]